MVHNKRMPSTLARITKYPLNAVMFHSDGGCDACACKSVQKHIMWMMKSIIVTATSLLVLSGKSFKQAFVWQGSIFSNKLKAIVIQFDK